MAFFWQAGLLTHTLHAHLSSERIHGAALHSFSSSWVVDCRVSLWRRLQARQRLRERREEKRREASAAAAPDPALLRAREAAASAAEAELLREEAEEVRASRVVRVLTQPGEKPLRGERVLEAFW